MTDWSRSEGFFTTGLWPAARRSIKAVVRHTWTPLIRDQQSFPGRRQLEVMRARWLSRLPRSSVLASEGSRVDIAPERSLGQMPLPFARLSEPRLVDRPPAKRAVSSNYALTFGLERREPAVVTLGSCNRGQ